MSLVAEFDIYCEALPLVGVASSVPEATLRLDFQYNHGRRPLFLLSTHGGTREILRRSLNGANDVGEWTFVGQAGDTRRYQIVPAMSLEDQLGEHVEDLRGLEALARAEAIIDRIVVTPSGWTQTGWFADREAFETFSSFWQENAGFRLHRLTPDGEAEQPGEGLTDAQNEALRIAYELGYFDIPRTATLEEIAEQLDISASSVSERLRRAQTQIIEETMATTWPPLPNHEGS